MVDRFNRVLKDFVQLASLEKRPLQEAITESLGVYRSTPHAATGKTPAYLLHCRNHKTRLNLAGPSSELFLQDPQKEMKLLRERVEEQQANVKRYTDTKRSARAQDFQSGDIVRVRLPGHRRKLVSLLRTETDHQPERTRHFSARRSKDLEFQRVFSSTFRNDKQLARSDG